MRFLFLLAVFVLVSGCELLTSGNGDSLDTWPDVRDADDRALPADLRDAYRYDAAQLAFHLIQPSDEIALPENLVGSIYAALVHVYNARDLPARDEIVGIHVFPHPSTVRLLVRLDTTVAWTHAWRAGNRLTGNAAIDALVEAYDLQIDYRDWASGHTALVTAPEPLNTPALGARFAAIEGVRDAYPDGAVGDGNNIDIEARAGAWVLDYSRGSGDCPAGCIHRTYWTFRVAESGAVVFLGTRSR